MTSKEQIEQTCREAVALVREETPRFSLLTDLVLKAAQQAPWDLVAEDGCRGHFIARHIHTVLGAVAAQNGTSAPAFMALANSRKARQDPAHTAAVECTINQLVTTTGIQRVLIVTDCVQYGNALSTLAGHFEASGANADLAVLCHLQGYGGLAKIKSGLKPRSVLLDERIPNASKLLYETLAEATGFVTIPGIPEPQANKAAVPEVVTAAHTAFNTFTAGYIAAKLPASAASSAAPTSGAAPRESAAR